MLTRKYSELRNILTVSVQNTPNTISRVIQVKDYRIRVTFP